jgi:uncharacterized protein YjbJ (UPF0337 family)
MPVPFKLRSGNVCPPAWFRQVPSCDEALLRRTARGRNEFSYHSVIATVSPEKQEEQAMNWDRVEGNWKQFKGKAQQQWGKLTDDDLDVIEGKRTELSGKLQARYGYAKDEAEKNIDTWLNSVN